MQGAIHHPLHNYLRLLIWKHFTAGNIQGIGGAVVEAWN